MNMDRSKSGLHSSAFVADSAVVIGDVTMGAETSVWFGCVVRGDRSPVRIGERCNIQDGVIVHEDPEYPVTLGDDVSLGHGAIVHGAVIGNGVLVGIRAVVLNGARIGEGSVIGAGALVPPGADIPPGSVVLGIPGKVVRQVTDADRDLIQRTARNYVRLSREYLADRGKPPA
jgi:carbonic anhydrase/acetyltransferase-like protein (isoleucine patch superfamily)